MHLIKKQRRKRDGNKPIAVHVGIRNINTGERVPLCGAAFQFGAVDAGTGDKDKVTCRHCQRALSWRRKRFLVRVINLRYDAHFSQRDKVVLV
jgi:hypothetical protein